MTITASCGHILGPDEGKHGLGFPAISQGQTRECAPCIVYSTLCAACVEKYKEWGIWFDTDEEAEAWLLSSQKHERMNDHEFKNDPNICTVCQMPRSVHKHDFIPSHLASRGDACWTCGRPPEHELHAPSEDPSASREDSER